MLFLAPLGKPLNEPEKLERGLGLVEATSLNVTFMVGIGPFIVIPLVVQAMGGPQSLLAWVVGAALALMDGCVWAELGAAMPRGGRKLRLSARGLRPGPMGPLDVVPLHLANAVSGAAEHRLGRAWICRLFDLSRRQIELAHRDCSSLFGAHAESAIAAAAVVVAVVLLYRRITTIGKISIALCVIVVGTILWLIYGGATHFNPSLSRFPARRLEFVLDFLRGAGPRVGAGGLQLSRLLQRLQSGRRNEGSGKEYSRARSSSPSSASPSSISPCRPAFWAWCPGRKRRKPKRWSAFSSSASMGRSWASAATWLILVTAFGSIFSATLGYSRIPYAAALDGNFFSVFARVHPTKRFPHISLLALGATAIFFCLALSLGQVIRAILAMRCLIQFVGQALGLMLLARRWKAEQWPFRMWVYPVPVLIAIAGWLAIFISTGREPMLASLAAAAAGILVYLVRARYLRQWPFEEVAQ